MLAKINYLFASRWEHLKKYGQTSEYEAVPGSALPRLKYKTPKDNLLFLIEFLGLFLFVLPTLALCVWLIEKCIEKFIHYAYPVVHILVYLPVATAICLVIYYAIFPSLVDFLKRNKRESKGT